ncbi:HpcH/HpaI aldolase/citrate lyase family protein [Salinibaculum rarum]|uniref:HpcH/HpaI aldolase/citrate lyase family protein n=1 Tax=Salinibaculum rarum TaxID=3058903 RepID=UPI00265DFBE7|nr:CoA ester lyase [Salinibaculum sp. KK48]
MPRRSVLFTPGDKPDKLRTAPDSGADVVVFDLEDGVAPAAKDRARTVVNDVLCDIDPDCEVCVRVNPTGIAADDDLGAVLSGDPRLDSVMLPKVSDADDVETLVRLLAEHDADLPVLALVESAAGVLHAEAIATADATDALLFGAEDYAADVGATRTAEGTEVVYARQRVVAAASAAGIDAIDTLYTDFEDAKGLRQDTERGIEMGYDGKMTIHPQQVTVVNDAFTPSDERLAWAERVLDARADADGQGVVAVDGEMIDAPLVAQAERIVARAEEAGKR